jgi:transcription factor MBP1
MVKGVAVMRRRSDSWLNATQILKVAGFDKPQRTRILEREVQKGEHEKVQGGYGKYQGMCPCWLRSHGRIFKYGPGTWIPIERGLQLAKQYNCEHLLQPIIDFQPAAKSPPLAPKHLVATPAPKPPAGGGKHTAAPAVSTTVTTRASRKHGPPVEVVRAESEVDELDERVTEDGTMTPSPSEASSSSRTPSPIGSPRGTASERPRKMRRTERHAVEPEPDQTASYADQMLEYFISDANQIPSVLISPPRDFNPNMAIDDDGHTALHWAAAMGRVRVVKLLLSAGADIYNVNKAGQTALMRAVMFANNYDVRKFKELYELLHRSTLNIDHHNRTVFHHIVDVAMTKGKSHAARYYMETVLERLADYPTELADVVNFQDEDGETALTLAARCRSKRLVKLLIDVGANPKIANHDGKTAEDYILEDERFRASPVPASRAATMSTTRNMQPAAPPAVGWVPGAERAQLHHSAIAQRVSSQGVSKMQTLLDGLAQSMDGELREKERDVHQAHALLNSIQAEILESQRAASQLRAQATDLPALKQEVAQLEAELLSKMGQRYRHGWERWISEEDERERAAREAGHGAAIGPEAPYGDPKGSAADAASFKSLQGLVDASMFSSDGNGGLGVAGFADPSAPGTKHRIEIDEAGVRDLAELHANVPDDPAALAAECENLRAELRAGVARREHAFVEAVKAFADAGAATRIAQYRKLIAHALRTPVDEVDLLAGQMLEVGPTT